MSQRYRNFLSWPEARRAQTTQKDKDAYTRQISKHQGMQDAVQHYNDQLMAACTAQWLHNKQQLHGQVVQRAEQLALEAMDKLQDTLGSLLKLKGKLSVSKTVCARQMGANCSQGQWQAERQAARYKGPRCPRARDEGPDHEADGRGRHGCGPVPRAAAQLVVRGGALGVSACSEHHGISELGADCELGPVLAMPQLTGSVGGATGGRQTVCATASRQAGSVVGWTSGQRTARQQTFGGIIAPLDPC
jgi:hypothetical protein